MPESLGARLRQQREEHDIALSTIAEETKIKRSLLEELERDDVSHWPAGIFRRAYIRAYAHAIGLEPDVLVREFLERHPDPMEDVAPIPQTEPGVESAVGGKGPPTRFGDLIRRAIRSFSGRRHATQSRGTTTLDLSKVHHEPVKARPFHLDLLAAARLCTELGRADKPSEMPPLLQEAARILDAIGLIVWVWDPEVRGLRPALAHGYADTALAHMPTVGRDAANATAEAFRSAQPCTVKGSDQSSGALVVPLMTATGCGGVLAIELRSGGEQAESVRAFATILAAQLARSVGSPGATGALRIRPGQVASPGTDGALRNRGRKATDRPQARIVQGRTGTNE